MARSKSQSQRTWCPLSSRTGAERILRALARHATTATELGLRALGEARDPDCAWDEALVVRLFTRVRLPRLETRLLDFVDGGVPAFTQGET